ncbi:MAG: hypothetical protein RLZZ241_2231 [Bacteroidota bacterium]|jgi:hypothetical protein
MAKRLFFSILIFTSLSLTAQNSTVSPYSAFGLGEFRSIRSVENQSMGGLTFFGDSIHLNLNNPAALGKLGLATYAGSLSRKQTQMATESDKQGVAVTNMEYIALALPLAAQRAGLAFGIKPFSSVGYTLEDIQTTESGANILNEYTGSGGLNQVFLGLGFQLLPKVHFGAMSNYYFGQLRNKRVQVTDGIAYGTLDQRQSDVSGFDFNLALSYSPNIGPKHSLYSTVRLQTQANLVSKNERVIGTFVPISGNDIETEQVDLAASNLLRPTIGVPATYSFGLGIGENYHWMLGGEYSMQQFSNFSNPFLDDDNISYADASTLAIGGFWVPDHTEIDNYFRRIAYRAGVRMENSGFLVNNQEINNFGITFGMGLPMGFEYSNINVGFEVGRRGATVNGLVRESYLKVSLGLSLNASGPNRWFQKRQIN